MHNRVLAVLLSLGATAAFGAFAPAHAVAVNSIYDLDLNAMSAGTCPAGVCGQVTVSGDTTSSLTFTVDLASGVAFHANHTGSSGTGPFFYFDLTDSAGPAITFSGIGTNGSIDATHSYSYNSPTGGSFDPNPGNFPGPYNYEVTCTNNTDGKICNGPLTFTASGATTTNPFVIGAPLGHGLFPSDTIAFVADLAVSGSCGRDTPCTAGTGLVGSSLESECTDCAPPPNGTPLPGAVWLFGSVLAGGAGFGRWRKKRKALAAAA